MTHRQILVVFSGLMLGMLLAADGQAVTNLERDAQEPPKDPEEAWDSWERRGVNQFRLPHIFMPRYRQILEEELPDVAAAIGRDGTVRVHPVREAPESLTGGARPGDGRYRHSKRQQSWCLSRTRQHLHSCGPNVRHVLPGRGRHGGHRNAGGR